MLHEEGLQSYSSSKYEMRNDNFTTEIIKQRSKHSTNITEQPSKVYPTLTNIILIICIF